VNSNNLVFTVSELNSYVKVLMEHDENLNYLFVAGEVTNFTANRSGHYYMSLKDAGGSVKAVMFKNAVVKLRFVPENGMRVICRGRASLYEATGQYQFYIDDMQPDGAGSIAVALEQLKEKLAAEGLFDEKYKKALPDYPDNVAIITSSTGAALQDMLNILGRRFPLAGVLHYPVQVQGNGAAGDMVKALALADASRADVIIIGRGGGSSEDLWEFNSEELARTIFACETPVVSAVGHETDYTICDFVADLRAPTPSAAAELCVPDISELFGVVRGFQSVISNAFIRMVTDKRYELLTLSEQPVFADPKKFIYIHRAKVKAFDNSIRFSMLRTWEKGAQQVRLAATTLDALSPLKTLSRGYAKITHDSHTVFSVSQLNKRDIVEILYSDGSMSAEIKEINI